MDDPGAEATRELDAAKLEALVETMYLAAYADGEFSDIERAHFSRSVDRLTEGRIPPTQFDKVLEALQERLATAGREACIGSIRDRLPGSNLRSLAVLLAADITAADGVIRKSERDVLFEIARALGVNESEAAELVQGFEQG